MSELTVAESLIQSKQAKVSLNKEWNDREHSAEKHDWGILGGREQDSLDKPGIFFFASNKPAASETEHTLIPHKKLRFIIQQLPAEWSWKCSKAVWCWSQRFALWLRRVSAQVSLLFLKVTLHFFRLSQKLLKVTVEQVKNEHAVIFQSHITSHLKMFHPIIKIKEIFKLFLDYN